MPAGLLLLLLQGAGGGQDAAARVVAVDPRIELVALVERLAGAQEYRTAPDSPYLRAAEAWFAPFSDHPAVAMARRLRDEASISYDAPITLAIHVRPPPGLAPVMPLDPLPAGVDPRWTPATAAAWLAALRGFARDARFEEFWDSQADARARIESTYDEVFAGARVAPWFASFFRGTRQVRARVLVSPLLGQSNYGARRERPGRPLEAVQVLGFHECDAEGRPALGPRVVPLLVHETAHAYVNPFVDARLDVLRKPLNVLYAPVMEDMRRQAYGQWPVLGKESLVRATVLLWMREQRGEAEAVAYAREQQVSGFHWVVPLAERLEEFRDARERFPDLDAFAPRLVSFFREWSERPPRRRLAPFLGPVNAVFAFRGPGSMLAVGVPPEHPAAGYVRAVYRQFLAPHGVPLVLPAETEAARARDRALVLYGTPRSNPFLAEALRRLDWKITAEGIQLEGRRFEGAGLRLIACHPSPWAKELPILVYAAQRDEDLAGIQDVFHGPADWLVLAPGEDGVPEPVASGDFPKDLQGNWGRLGEER